MTHPEISRVTRSKAQARTTYDRLSHWYDWLAASSERPLAEIGLQHLNPRAGETVLEIGCGTGHAMLVIASVVGASGTVHGVDLSHGMLSIAMRKILLAKPSARVALEQGDGIHLPFAIKSFNAVFLSFALELFDTPEIPLVLSECRRALKPGGRICVVSMSRGSRETIPLKIYEWFHQRIPAYVDCRPIYVQPMLTQAGFQIQEVTRKQMWGLPVEICIAQSP
jgi:ubiquinone/menaquinone biosynthesis C-methylase UbiE